MERHEPDTETGETLDALALALTGIVDRARAHVAAGEDPGPGALEKRIRAAGTKARKDDPGQATAIERAEERAIQQLERLAAVHRARTRIAEPPQRPPQTAPPQQRRPVLRTRPTISGNMDVRRTGDDETVTLAWDTASAVAGWEVRISERPDSRADYAVLETRALSAAETSAELELGDRPRRVHILGRARDGRPVRRAMISGLTRDNWRDRWQQRASAS